MGSPDVKIEEGNASLNDEARTNHEPDFRAAINTTQDRSEKAPASIKSRVARLDFLPYLVCGAIITLAKLPTLTNNVLFIDEPAYLVEAQRLDSFGAFVYSAQYITETKFQLGLVPYMAALWLNHSQAILLVHLFGLVALLLSVILMVAISRLVFNTAVPAIFATVFWAFYLNWYGFTLPTLLEVFQAPLVLFACWFFIRALVDKTTSYGNLVWSGVFVGLATLVKPPAAVLIPVFLVALAAKVWHTRPVRAAVIAYLRMGAMLVAGTGLPIAIFVAPYLLNSDALSVLKFNFVDLASAYATQSDRVDVPTRIRILLQAFKPEGLLLLIASLLLIPALNFLLRFGKKNGADKSESLPPNYYQWLLFGSGCLLFLAFSVGQIKLHYLIPVVPLVMLAAGYRLWVFFQRLPACWLQTALAVVFVVGLAVSEINTFQDYVALYGNSGQVYPRDMPDVDVNAVVKYVDTNTGSQDRIWVYYNAPEIYWMANRKPATSEPVGTWLIDFYDQFWFDRTYQQLEADNVKLIVGIDKPRYARAKVEEVRQLPRVGDLIAQHFTCDDKTIANVVVCKRN